jgi:hypothetical protein
MIKIIFVLLISVLLFIKCTEKKPKSISFNIQSPYQQTIKENNIKTTYLVLDSGSTGFYNIGDTLSYNQFDSTGALIHQRILSSDIRNYYDSNGFIKYTKTTTDYFSEFFVATFIDSTRHILYQKWFDQLADFPTTIIYFNESGQADSSLAAYYQQGWPIQYKEYFIYKNNLLVKSTKITIDTLEARSKGKPKLDSTLYTYDNKQLKTIKSYKIFMDGQPNITTDYFISGIPTLRLICLGKYAVKERVLPSKK